jgi:hypothetical protein
VAVLGGAGSFAIKMRFKGSWCLFDRRFEVSSVLWSRKPTAISRYWHFESERYKKLYCWVSSEKILNFAVILSEENQIQLSTYRIWRIRKN